MNHAVVHKSYCDNYVDSSNLIGGINICVPEFYRIFYLKQPLNKLEKQNKKQEKQRIRNLRTINKKITEKFEKLKKKHYKQRDKLQFKNEQKQELFNSVKNFGKNYLKGLGVTQKSLMRKLKNIKEFSDFF